MRYYIIVGFKPTGIIPMGIVDMFEGTEEEAEVYRSKLKGKAMFEISKQAYDLRKQANAS